MADSSIKIRARAAGGSTTVKALIRHPMETGTRREQGETVPAHHITEVTVALNGKPVMTAHWGPGVARNPYLSFKIAGASKGDAISLTWVDNQGQSDSVEDTVG